MKNIDKIFQKHKSVKHQLNKQELESWADKMLKFLVPELCVNSFTDILEFERHVGGLKTEFESFLFQLEVEKKSLVSTQFFETLESVLVKLEKDFEAFFQGDPAAKSIEEVKFTYPGVLAIVMHRLAHEMCLLKIPIIPRLLAEYAHSKTGIDIHPGAKIGESFCIDHGTGVVIGETTVVGKNVKIYQGVTLGALSVRKEDAKEKRHPTIKDNVVIYAGATILGGKTVIGENSIIGGNVWIVDSVPSNSKIYFK